MSDFDELESSTISALDLPAIHNKNLTFDLPDGLKVNHIRTGTLVRSTILNYNAFLTARVTLMGKIVG